MMAETRNWDWLFVLAFLAFGGYKAIEWFDKKEKARAEAQAQYNAAQSARGPDMRAMSWDDLTYAEKSIIERACLRHRRPPAFE